MIPSAPPYPLPWYSQHISSTPQPLPYRRLKKGPAQVPPTPSSAESHHRKPPTRASAALTARQRSQVQSEPPCKLLGLPAQNSPLKYAGDGWGGGSYRSAATHHPAFGLRPHRVLSPRLIPWMNTEVRVWTCPRLVCTQRIPAWGLKSSVRSREGNDGRSIQDGVAIVIRMHQPTK
jgi:hypothetical protein